MKKFAGPFAVLMGVLFAMSLLTGCELNNGGGDDDDDVNPSKDKNKIVGTWTVVTPWRWSKMTFNANGTRSVVDRSTGETLTRGTWSLQNGKMVVVSDVTEKWDYVVKKNSLTVTLPSGNVIQMAKAQ
jgi:hypothetical protein